MVICTPVSQTISSFHHISQVQTCNNFLGFEPSYITLVINQECSQTTQHIISGPHQDGEHYSRKDYGWFLMGLPIFNFSSNLTGPDME